MDQASVWQKYTITTKRRIIDDDAQEYPILMLYLCYGEKPAVVRNIQLPQYAYFDGQLGEVPSMMLYQALWVLSVDGDNIEWIKHPTGFNQSKPTPEEICMLSLKSVQIYKPIAAFKDIPW